MRSFNKGCVTHRSMPVWCVSNALSDPFGGSVMPQADSLEIVSLISECASEGLLEMTAFHDDDLVPWNPENPEDDLDEKSSVYERLLAIKETLKAADVAVNTATCSLHGNPIFRNGGLCNPDPEIRRLAALKVERTLRIGRFLGARHYVYWVARDGFEVPAVTQWNNVYKWLADGLNHVTDYIKSEGMSNYIGASLEPKPNEPRGQMFIPTSGHAAGFIYSHLRNPDFWGVNPELLQHESMALMNACMTVAYLCSMNKLKFLHFGSQIKAQFDNDFPPMTGPEGLKETVFMFKALKDIGWNGIVEYDCHMLRAEADPGAVRDSRRRFIKVCADALDTALELSERIKPPRPDATQSEADIESIRQMCGL